MFLYALSSHLASIQFETCHHSIIETRQLKEKQETTQFYEQAIYLIQFTT